MKIFVIPDTQVKPGVRTDHIEAAGNYCAEKQPDVIVHLGDHFDLPSLSSYAPEGEREGKRYKDDVAAGIAAMERFITPIRRVKGYKPRLHFTLGNHCQRIVRTVDETPRLKGTMSLDDLKLTEMGWRVHPFLKVVRIAGIEFSHYFTSGVMGRPVSSAQALLTTRQNSAVMGHVQSRQYAVHPKTQNFALFGGCFYTHREEYLTPQGNETRPMVYMLHEARDGRADLMEVSADFLLRHYW